MTSPAKLATNLLAAIHPNNPEASPTGTFLEKTIKGLRMEGKGKLAGRLARLVDALHQVSTGDTPSAASKATLAASDEILRAYSTQRRKEAADYRENALSPPGTEATALALMKLRQDEGLNDATITDVERGTDRMERSMIRLDFEAATFCDAIANFVESLRPRFAELSEAVGLDERRSRGR
jgi:hypothetical protein